jgi:hypothetical protein
MVRCPGEIHGVKFAVGCGSDQALPGFPMKDMFRGSELKIERAQKHINELEANIRDFAKGESHTVRVENDARARCNVFHITMAETTLTNFALIIGDAIHNLRSHHRGRHSQPSRCSRFCLVGDRLHLQQKRPELRQVSHQENQG